ncbi:MAG: TIGR00730 family Rossman fold protein [Candidatus Omnitrophica bacterium]|nr:TIGR00730 family Rossman fold protein [Candidatus Omnitrophota bacterium]
MVREKKSFIDKHEFDTEDPWRIFRIMSEFVEGFEVLSSIGKAVSIFGSARLSSSHKYYKLAEEVAYLLAKEKYAIITGSGPSLMEAANKGAKRAKGYSVGLNIQLPLQQNPNPYVDTLLDFRYFFIRKVMFVKYAKAFVIMPGGYGTLDEFMEAINLISTDRIPKFPVIVVGKEYWKGLMDWLKNTVLKTGCISEEDLCLFKAVDKPKEVVKIIKDFYKSHKSLC